MSTQYPIVRVRSSHTPVNSITASRQVRLYSSMDILWPMSSFVMPSFFSTPSSTGRPWVSQPAFRRTRKPFWVL